jgi:CBS domain-containing protein
MTKLRDVISGKVLSVEPGATVAEACAAMVQARVGSAVVIDGPWLVGIFTERDALRAAASGQDLNTSQLKEWMTPEPMTVGPDTETEEVAVIMASHGFRHLPVVEGEQVVGVVSLRDVLSSRIRRSGG